MSLDFLFGDLVKQKAILPIRRDELPEVPRGTLTGIFEFLDNPGAAVRNTLDGIFNANPKKFIQAGKNVADFLTFEQFNFAKARNNTNLGFIGNVALDPLTYVAGTGLFAESGFNILKSAGNTGAAKNLIASALSRPARKALARHARKVTPKGVSFHTTLNKMKEELTGFAKNIKTEDEFLASLTNASPELKSALGDILPKGNVLESGGFKLGIPFTDFESRLGAMGARSKLVQRSPLVPRLVGGALDIAGLKSGATEYARKLWPNVGRSVNERLLINDFKDAQKVASDTGERLGLEVSSLLGPNDRTLVTDEIFKAMGRGGPNNIEIVKEGLRAVGKTEATDPNLFRVIDKTQELFADILDREFKAGVWDEATYAKLKNGGVYAPLMETETARRYFEDFSSIASEMSKAKAAIRADPKLDLMEEFTKLLMNKAKNDPKLLINLPNELNFTGISWDRLSPLEVTKQIIRKIPKVGDKIKKLTTPLVERDIGVLVARRVALGEKNMAKLNFFAENVAQGVGKNLPELAEESIAIGKEMSRMRKEVLEESIQKSPELIKASDEELGILINETMTKAEVKILEDFKATHNPYVRGTDRLKPFRELENEVMQSLSSTNTNPAVVDFITTEKFGVVGKRKPVSKWWATLTQPFKKGSTFGLGPLVNFSFLTRNAIGGLEQAARRADNPAEFLKIVLAYFDSGTQRMMEKFVPEGSLPQFYEKLSDLETLLNPRVSRAAKRKVTFEGLNGEQVFDELGERVLGNNFVDIEKSLKKLDVKIDKPKKFLDLAKTLSVDLQQWLENTMRSRSYLSLRGQGFSPSEAGFRVKQAFVDYEYSSVLNRAIRDVFPFAQFAIGNVPEVIRTLGETPRFYSVFKEFMRNPDELLLPEFIKEQPAFRIGGSDEEPSILSQIGLPFEQIGGLGNPLSSEGQKNILQGVSSSLNPLPKYLLQKTFNRDFFFKTEFPAYRKANALARGVAFVSPRLAEGLFDYKEIDTPYGKKFEMSPDSRAYIDIVTTSLGISRALGSIEKSIDALVDGNRTYVDLLLNTFTGARVFTVNQQRQAKKVIKEHLKEQARNGNVGEFRRFFMVDEDQVGPDVSGDLYEKLEGLVKRSNRR